MEMDKKQVKTLVLGAMSCILLYWVLNDMERVRAIGGGVFRMIQPFLVGACIAFVLNVPMRAIERHLSPNNRKVDKIRRPLALVMTLAAVGGIISLAFNVIGPGVKDAVLSIAEQIPGAVFCETLPEVTAWIRENAREGDIILTIGAGDIYRAGEALLK